MNIPIPIRRKLEYSKRLLDILDSEIVSLLNAKSDDEIRNEYNEISSFRALMEGREVPGFAALICGDLLQNVRSTLDYLMWELVIANKQEPDDKNAFPVCIRPKVFKEASKVRLRGVHPDAIAIVESLQPYHFGEGNESESSLFVLDKLTTIQKHRTILLTQERHAPVDQISVVDPDGNVLGFDSLLATDGKATARYLKDAFEKKVTAEMAVFVEFGEYPAKDMEVISVVAGIYEGVALDIIPRFERFFA